MKNKEQVFLFLKTEIEKLESTEWGKAKPNQHGMSRTQKHFILYQKRWFEFGFEFVKFGGKYFSDSFSMHYQGGNGCLSCVYVKHTDNPYSKPTPFNSVMDAVKDIIPDMQRELEREDKELPNGYKNILRWTIEYLENSQKILTLF